jgi:hypothetical protein
LGCGRLSVGREVYEPCNHFTMGDEFNRGLKRVHRLQRRGSHGTRCRPTNAKVPGPSSARLPQKRTGTEKTLLARDASGCEGTYNSKGASIRYLQFNRGFERGLSFQ